MVSRKPLSEKKKEKPEDAGPPLRKPDPKWNLDLLPDAIQEGKFTAGVGDEIVVVRPRDGKMQKSLCVVKNVLPDRVETYDETRGQFYTFPLVGLEKHGITVKRTLKSS